MTISVAGHQTLRALDGSYVLDRPADVTEVIPRADVLAVVFGPDGSTVMRRDDTGEDAWSALWNGGDGAHDVPSFRPIGWMSLPRCCRRPATKSGGDRDVGQRVAYCQVSMVSAACSSSRSR